MSVVALIGIGAGILLLGLLLGRYYVPDTRPLKRAAKEGAMYIRGLNHVLAQDKDAAIAELTRAVSQNIKTVDTYFALGVLFRERGEYERAVRVHQSILVRGDATRTMRLKARFQLGLDFEAAGFRRRARKAFEEVLKASPKHRDAATKLLDYYESAREWDPALKALYRLRKITKDKSVDGPAGKAREAHLYAERGQDALEAGSFSSAKSNLKKARKLNPEGVHVHHLEALYLRRSGSPRKAALAWLRLMTRVPDLAGFFFPFIEEALFEDESLDELGAWIDKLVDENPDNAHLRLVQARFLGKRNPEVAFGILRTVLEDAPSLMPARRLAGRIALAQGPESQIRREYEELLLTLERIERDYRCARCGHTTRQLFWRCPKCHAWESVRVAWGRRAGEGIEPVGPAIPGGAVDRRASERR